MNEVKLLGYNKETTCGMGDLFLLDGMVHILAKVSNTHLVFISLEDGSRYHDSCEIKHIGLDNTMRHLYRTTDVIDKLTDFDDEVIVDYLGSCKITLEE